MTAARHQRNRERLDALAITYEVKGHTIPNGITMLERKVFIQGAGMPELPAAVMAVQDRGSSLANALGGLIAQSGRQDLIERAEELIDEWNHECGAFFQSK